MDNQLLDGDMLNRNSQSKSIQQIISEGFEVKPMQYIQTGIDIFKKYALGFFAFEIVFFIMMMIIYFVMGLIPYVGSLLAGAISSVFSAGMIIVSKKVHKNEEYDFGNFFDGTKKFKDIFTGSLIISCLTMLIIAVFAFSVFKMIYLEGGNNFQNFKYMRNPMEVFDAFKWMLLALIPLIILHLLYSFFSTFASLTDFGFWDSLESSRKIVQSKILHFFLFYLLIFIFIILIYFLVIGIALLLKGSTFGIILIGILLFGFILCIFPILTATVYAAYDDIVGEHVVL